MDEQTPRYVIVIDWDPKDRIYVATVPNLRFIATHGDTSQEALERVLELMAEWLELARESGVTPPSQDRSDRRQVLGVSCYPFSAFIS